jgi:hypothetical protein
MPVCQNADPVLGHFRLSQEILAIRIPSGRVPLTRAPYWRQFPPSPLIGRRLFLTHVETDCAVLHRTRGLVEAEMRKVGIRVARGLGFRLVPRARPVGGAAGRRASAVGIQPAQMAALPANEPRHRRTAESRWSSATGPTTLDVPVKSNRMESCASRVTVRTGISSVASVRGADTGTD